MNTMTINGYQAVIAFDPDIQMFRGEFVSLNGGADFYRMSGSHTADNAALIRIWTPPGLQAFLLMVLGYDCFRISGFLLGRTDPSHDGICARGSYRPSGFARCAGQGANGLV